ncbi:TadE/TadG family type IV pilus assembly protein [Brevundimonas sp.]|uniref:TadE/TadG family type IV pilus assembly protein n=1 Tax=Brevundimonas sp. TaxID=1871086 RepID=UPI0022BE2E2B|nr:TadE/TadG family type IV pilus assembly protein [Brevundimonas sp.]MCZ8193250.1 pilus assembly protein [Brevundimonas sp.]
MSPFGLIRRLFRDSRGVSAVEFALIAPIMILMYLGAAEMSQAYMAQKRATHVASVIADLTTQTTALNQDMVDDIFAAGEHILQPFPVAPLSQRLTSIGRDGEGDTSVLWTRTSGSGEFGPTSSITIPPDVLENNETIIVAEVIYVYNSPIGNLLPTGLQFESIFFLRPRLANSITCC